MLLVRGPEARYAIPEIAWSTSLTHIRLAHSSLLTQSAFRQSGRLARREARGNKGKEARRIQGLARWSWVSWGHVRQSRSSRYQAPASLDLEFSFNVRRRLYKTKLLDCCMPTGLLLVDQLLNHDQAALVALVAYF